MDVRPGIFAFYKNTAIAEQDIFLFFFSFYFPQDSVSELFLTQEDNIRAPFGTRQPSDRSFKSNLHHFGTSVSKGPSTQCTFPVWHEKPVFTFIDESVSVLGECLI